MQWKPIGWLALILILASVTAKTSRNWDRESSRPLTFAWTMSPSYGRYSSFAFRIRSTETGAVYTTSIIDHKERKFSRSGIMSVDEYRNFCLGLQEVGVWTIGDGDEERSHAASFHVTVASAWRTHQASFHGLPTPLHKQLWNYVMNTIVGFEEHLLSELLEQHEAERVRRLLNADPGRER